MNRTRNIQSKSTVLLREQERYGDRKRPVSLILRQRKLVDRIVRVKTIIEALKFNSPEDYHRIQRYERFLSKLQAIYNFYTRIIQKAVMKQTISDIEKTCWDRANNRMKLRRKR